MVDNGRQDHETLDSVATHTDSHILHREQFRKAVVQLASYGTMESEFQKSLPCFCSCPYHLLGSHGQSGHLQHAFRTGLINAERIFKDCKFLQAEAGYSKSIRPPQLKQLIGPPMAVNQRPQRQSQIRQICCARNVLRM